MIDASLIRVHQHAANDQKRRAIRLHGRPRGGLMTKINALAEADSCPIHLKLAAEQAHDRRSAANMFETFRPGQILLADRAYDSGSLHQSRKE